MNRLKELRLKSNLTLRELNEKTGIIYSVLADIENGKRSLNTNVAVKLSQFYNVSVDYLMGVDFKERLTKFINDIRRDYTNVRYDEFNDPDIYLDKGELSNEDFLMLKSILELSELKEDYLLEAYKEILKIADKQHASTVSFEDFLD